MISLPTGRTWNVNALLIVGVILSWGLSCFPVVRRWNGVSFELSRKGVAGRFKVMSQIQLNPIWFATRKEDRKSSQPSAFGISPFFNQKYHIAYISGCQFHPFPKIMPHVFHSPESHSPSYCTQLDINTIHCIVCWKHVTQSWIKTNLRLDKQTCKPPQDHTEIWQRNRPHLNWISLALWLQRKSK